ncbi:calnexin [Microthyrium microscopicum]|uniref:Calnexin n=1 Tax=Microthyrium microscopicum TaxID=703497 RepID=A0A6A6URZ5_9PEZI|nr:calnexin [Microthyrium microscopicum]
MRYAFVASALLCASVAFADDASSASSSESSTSSSSTVANKPTFTPTKLKPSGGFLEQFTDNWDTRWKPSHAKKEKDKDSTSEEEWAYVGKWAVEEPHVLGGMVGDKGLVVKDKAAHHAISAKFEKPISAKGKPLVVQYEVKLQDGLECGGAYMKLLQDNKKLHREEFSNASPYIIMFGPDKCGATNKVHFIFRHKNPKTGEYEEKHLDNPPLSRSTKLSALYQLVVHPNNTFIINIDGEQVSTGSLLENFTPAVNPPKEIDDEADKKPETWVDESRIADPEAKKPEDWDEDAPFEIPDTDAKKPEDWLDDEPSMVPDPEAEKPEDWDDEEDGDWVAPQVPNPKCSESSGCGKWEVPMKKNEAYKGKWTAPLIDNPKYKGEWAPRKIANPKYFEDKTPANFEPLGAIGFELWTMQNDIMFDNIYIGNSVEDAEALKKETWDLKIEAEKAEEKLNEPKFEDIKDPSAPIDFKKDPVGFVKQKAEAFITAAKADPIKAAQEMPEVAGVLGVTALTILALILTALSPSAPSKEQIKAKANKAKDAAEKAKDKAAEAISSGVDQAKDATKRSTRSSTAGAQ